MFKFLKLNNEIMEVRNQTRNEELANGISHILGVFFCLIAMPYLIKTAYMQHDMQTVLSVFAYGIGMLSVYLFSALYHLEIKEKTKYLLNIADHISIYYLIAGTYSPLMIVYLDKENACIFLSILWLLVVLGTFFKLFFIKRFELVSVVFYLLMGCMIVFVIKPLWGVMPFSVFLWILAGGFCYTLGIYFFLKESKKYYHTIWHFCVLLGTVFHYVAVYKSL
jgi:hemolysin III